MKRRLDQFLVQWKNDPARKPLLVRGARQIGKTFTICEFGRGSFENLAEVNFELEPRLKAVFESSHGELREIVKNLSLLLNVPILPGRTLLFLDEVQECPRAISALRYFYEKMPDLHVIAAGSLLEFALEGENFEMPVGRVQYLFMRPVSFQEFLWAKNETSLSELLDEIDIASEINDAVHEKLLRLFKDYLIVGGMPEAVARHVRNPADADFGRAQLTILQTYRDDFGKYARRARLDLLQRVFQTAPSFVGQVYKYSRVDGESQGREVKAALRLLEKAGVVAKVLSTSAHGLPFLKDADEKKFKIVFIDVGLMQKSCGLEAEIALSADFLQINAGAVAEQFVGQELMAAADPYEEPALFYWDREKKNSQAEVDFLISRGREILPVEVKSGKTGSLKSLRLFLKEHPQSPFGIRLSQHSLSFHDNILSVPIYAAGQAARLARL